MEVKLETKKECDIVDRVVLSYESNQKIKKSADVDEVISILRNSISLYHINNIDKIGLMVCKYCGHEWTAVCSDKSCSLVCTECKKRNEIPKNIKN